MTSGPVIFIHGMFMTPACWADWIPRFGRAGFVSSAPAWPLRDASVEELRARHPDAELGKLTLDRVVAHYEAIIRASPKPPVLIGHSMGGLIVQLLLARGLGTAGVAIDSAPPRGVLSLAGSFLKSNWAILNPFISGRRPYLMPFEAFHYAFAHTLSEADARAVYDRHVVPESRLIGRAALTPDAEVDFAAERAPLLFIAGELDHIIPASLNRTNYKRHKKKSPSRTDFKEFPGRTHYLIGQEGWAELADFIQEWLRSIPS